MSERRSRLYLCLLRKEEVALFFEELQSRFPYVAVELKSKKGGIEVSLQSKELLDPCLKAIEAYYPTYCFKEKSIEEALQSVFLEKKKTLALAESCTGGAIGACLTQQSGASRFFLGSIVAYCNRWKEQFLQVSRTTLLQKGAVSKEVVVEMVKGLFQESDADYAAAVSGIAGPDGAIEGKPVGTIFLAIGKRGEKIDAGCIQAPYDRSGNIELTTQLILGALWRRLVHNAVSFS